MEERPHARAHPSPAGQGRLASAVRLRKQASMHAWLGTCCGSGRLTVRRKKQHTRTRCKQIHASVQGMQVGKYFHAAQEHDASMQQSHIHSRIQHKCTHTRLTNKDSGKQVHDGHTCPQVQCVGRQPIKNLHERRGEYYHCELLHSLSCQKNK